ncbi:MULTISPECIES: flagellar filament capping protein FliD [Paenibacillus]|uniref:flagellar filament capping protein FliD n=1 Tax=Paenibacillus TaxID=44249 RepID=UPI0013531E4B|nr:MULTISPECIES: flagellar filament capping protein FliD [Paenibacillus]MXO76670.1 flagellar filament capping protein FliD [Paenibacillus sp. OT2-17]QYK69664.1 Flagellar hook-associated protein 2 [Paenibacillus sp. S02]
MVTRITGLASGMDIDSMVKKLMTAESAPLDKLNQQKQLMEWKRENYRETSVKLVTFSQELSKLGMSSSISAQKANVTGNTSAVSASVSSTASGVLDVKVASLATASSATSSAAIELNASAPTDWGTVKLQDIKNSGISGTVPVIVKIGSGASEASIEIDPVNETIDSFVEKINSNKQAGVSAIYDSATGKVSLTSKTTGAKDIELSGDIFTALKLGSTITGGEDAKLTVNGLDITRSSNTFTMNGVELTLNNASGSTSTRIEVAKDTDKLVESVQKFVDAYNDVLSTLNNKVSEERYKKYAPLTTAQKKDMSDDEVKQWTDKAKSGMLKNDSILQSAVADMRSAMVQGVKLDDGTTISLAQLGITTGTYQTKGKLVLDTDKLKAALDKDPDIVTNFFSKQDSATAQSNKYTDQDGIFARMKKISNTALQKLADKAGTSKVSTDLSASFIISSTMGQELTGIDRRITDMTARLNMMETNYYKKFTAMETAINKYNSTSSSLSSFR